MHILYQSFIVVKHCGVAAVLAWIAYIGPVPCERPLPLPRPRRTPLILAAQNGLTNAVKALLESRADPSIKAQGKTALEFATQNAHHE